MTINYSHCDHGISRKEICSHCEYEKHVSEVFEDSINLKNQKMLDEKFTKEKMSDEKVTNERTKIDIKVDENFVYSIGSNSLLGYILKWYEDNNKPFTEMLNSHINLQFPKSSRPCLEKNNGSHEYIVTEYNIPCLLKDILWFVNHDMKIEISYYEVDKW
jgi:hypothetical protein